MAYYRLPAKVIKKKPNNTHPLISINVQLLSIPNLYFLCISRLSKDKYITL